MGENVGRDSPQIVVPVVARLRAGRALGAGADTDTIRDTHAATPPVLPGAAALRRPVPRRKKHLRESVLALILSGSDDTPLEALTRWHCLAALPFAGRYRSIDFALSNCRNSGIRRIGVVTQNDAYSFMQEVRRDWTRARAKSGESIELWPAQRRRDGNRYRGTADAAYQNIPIIRQRGPQQLLILAGDHVCRMNYAHMIDEHRRRDADVTLGYMELAVSEAGQSDVLGMDPDGWVKTLVKGPLAAAGARDAGELALVSLGVYVFDAQALIELLRKDAVDLMSWHEFGHDIVPAALACGLRVLGHPFRDAVTGETRCCRDVGTVDGYWRANMALLTSHCQHDARDAEWPIGAQQLEMPPARFVGQGAAYDSIVCAGSVLGGEVRHSVLAAGCTVGARTSIEDCVLLPNVRVGRHCRIKRAIIDAECVIADGTVIEAGSPLTPPSYVSPAGVVLYASAGG